MKALILAASLLVSPAFAADVGVSISIGQPGFYGRIDIGNDYPVPVLVAPRPVVVEPAYHDRAPIYLNVPPGHYKNWRKHCRQYNACGERVYFVRNDWYERQYAPHYRDRHPEFHGNRHDDRRDGPGRDHRDGPRDDRRDDHRDRPRDDRHDRRDRDDRGPGREDHHR
ncbi:hypothetical protein [Niveibacterium terrae]|uniref:hypothetical protein n=1 Tax=Niveibacterium terrae TaxID=3373598 RepID=UPI003A8DF441